MYKHRLVTKYMNVQTDCDESATSSETDSLGTYDETAGSAKLVAQSHQKSWLVKNYDEKNIPKKIEEIRKFRQSLIKETKIVELTKKYQFERYSFSRLTTMFLIIYT